MKKTTLYPLRSLLLLLPFIFPASNADSFEDVVAALQKQTYDFVQEKVYLHLDKPYYSKGEDLWFKAYTVAGPNHTPTPLSSNLYVELINPVGLVLKRHTIYMHKGLGNGDFQLPDSLAAGNYTIRAYTNWMRNFDEAFFFTKKIPVIEDIGAPSESIPFRPQVQFYPESGNLLTGFSSKIAFEISNYSEVSTKGEVFNQNDESVSNFEVSHNGIGAFDFIPQPDQTYYAVLNGNTEQFALPKPQSKGAVIAVKESEENFSVEISASGSKEDNQHFFILAHTRGLVSFASKLNWKGNFARVKIPKKDITEGIVHITLFDEKWRPEAERLVFKNPEGQIKLELSTDQDQFAPRDSTTLKIKLQNKDGKPLVGFFSLSAVDAGQIDTTSYNEDIMSSLLLSSDLDQKINSPSQYLKSLNAENLDLLLMTKGWSRFLWKDILNDNFPDNENEVERGFNLTGSVIDARTEKPLKSGKVKQIGTFYGVPGFEETEIKADGTFAIKNLQYYENDVLLQAENKKGKRNVVVQLDSNSIKSLPNFVNLRKYRAHQNLNTTLTSAFSELGKDRELFDEAYDVQNITGFLARKKEAGDSTGDFARGTRDLGEVVVKGERETERAQIRRTLIPRGTESYPVKFDDFMKFSRPLSTAHALVGRIPSYQIRLTGASWGIGEPTILLRNQPAVFFVDGIETPQTFVMTLPPEIIENAEVSLERIFLWTRLDGHYENPMLWEKDGTLGSTALPNYGYYRSREFYKPNYGQKLPEHIKPDRRALIHWEPMIETDENGEATVTFYNADLETSIHVQLEGIWEGGIPIVKTTKYAVKKD